MKFYGLSHDSSDHSFYSCLDRSAYRHFEQLDCLYPVSYGEEGGSWKKLTSAELSRTTFTSPNAVLRRISEDFR